MGKEIIGGLAHIGLYVKDVEISKKFYIDVLGFDLKADVKTDSGTKLCFLANGTCEIELIEQPTMENVDGYFNHVALRVDDIERAVGHMIAAGYEMEHEIREMPMIYSGIKMVMFRGPDGERLEFNEFL